MQYVFSNLWYLQIATAIRSLEVAAGYRTHPYSERYEAPLRKVDRRAVAVLRPYLPYTLGVVLNKELGDRKVLQFLNRDYYPIGYCNPIPGSARPEAMDTYISTVVGADRVYDKVIGDRASVFLFNDSNPPWSGERKHVERYLKVLKDLISELSLDL